MTKSKDAKDFIQMKGLVLMNLEALQMRIDECVANGMLDENSYSYNEVSAIMEMIDVCYTFEELEEIVIKGKEVEHTVDTWVAIRGGTTMELEWPSLKEFL